MLQVSPQPRRSQTYTSAPATMEAPRSSSTLPEQLSQWTTGNGSPQTAPTRSASTRPATSTSSILTTTTCTTASALLSDRLGLDHTRSTRRHLTLLSFRGVALLETEL